MKLLNIVMLLAFLMSGCAFVSGPKEKVNFSSTTSLSNLAGVYKNEGDPGQLLSEIIFGYHPIRNSGKSKIIEHKEITHIAVSVQSNRITVKAVNNDCYIYESVFVEGTDFSLDDGEIILKRDISLLSRGPGDVLAGPSYEKIAIGLEKEGHGVYRNQVYAGGLVFLLVPMAFSGLDEVRFERVDSNDQFRECEH